MAANSSGLISGTKFFFERRLETREERAEVEALIILGRRDWGVAFLTVRIEDGESVKLKGSGRAVKTRFFKTNQL